MQVVLNVFELCTIKGRSLREINTAMETLIMDKYRLRNESSGTIEPRFVTTPLMKGKYVLCEKKGGYKRTVIKIRKTHS